MKSLLSLLLLFSSSAWSWNCSADLNGKKLVLEKKEGSFELNHPDARHTYAIIPAKEGIKFVYLNSSANKKNFLRYVLNCPANASDCLGTFDSSYNGNKSQRPLVRSVSSRATTLKDNDRPIFEYSKRESELQISISESELSFECLKI